MRFASLGLSAACALATLIAPAAATAQTSMGAVNGTVTDSAGAVVPGATVTLVNEATGIRSGRQTNTSGHFVFVDVRPGTYVLTVELSGFNTAKTAAFTVGVNETVARNVTLKVGNMSEVVEVTAQSELLQTSTAELGHVVEERVIRAVPLQGRNFTQLLLLSPGVNPVSTAQGAGQNGGDSTGVGTAEGANGIAGGFISNASIQGQQNRSKIYYEDGIVNSSVRAGTYVALPDIDSLQEFKVQSQSDKAEFGGVLGGVVNMTSKSGGNRFHGGIWGFGRNDHFVARDPYRDVSAGKPTTPPPFRQSQFGVNVGGPIVKDKTFFYASYDGWRYDDKSQIRHIVPADDAWLDGDFSHMGRVIYNPFSTRVVNGKLVRDPFPGNVIPKEMISPTMQQFLRTYMIRPNLSGGDVVNSYNFVQLREETQDSNAFQVRIDHHFSNRDNVFFRWTERRNTAHQPIGDLFFKEPKSTNRNFGGGLFHTFSPSMILELRGGVATQPTEDAPLQHAAGFAAQQGLGLPQVERFQGYIVSGLSSAPWNLPGDMGVQGPRERQNPNWNAAADLSWLRGNHNLKLGFQYLRISRLQTNQFGQIFFSNEATRDPNATSTTGDVLASALLGIPTQIRGYMPDVGFIDFHTSTLSGYVQDQWTIRPNLTLTYGVRYDYVTRAVGDSKTFQSGPDLATGDWLIALPSEPAVCSADGSTPPPCLPAAVDKIPNGQHIRVTGERNSILKPITDNIGPRLGVAWQIDTKTVLRGGYGLMWDSMVSRSQYGQHQFETWGWPQVSGFDTGTINATGSPIQRVEDLSSLPFGLPKPQPWNATGAYFNDPDRKNAYSHQWHVELQRAFTRNLMVGVAYVGSYNGRMEYSGRAFAPKTAAIDPDTGRRLTPAERDQLRPWPWITSDARYSNDIGMAKYNAFELKLQHRFSEGLSSLLSYTYSRSIDTSSGWFAAENGIGGGGVVQNYWDIDDARGLSAYDVPHILTWATIWELPFGRGKRWLTEGPASWILGNWQLNWMLLARSGQPMTITATGDPANLGFSGYSRASLVPGVDPQLDHPTAGEWFNTDAFVAPVNAFGNSKRSILRAPAFWDVDLGLQKNVRIAKDAELQVRLEAFNVFNHINEGNPNTEVGNANFGRITSMASRPRQLQLGLRFTF
jgi:hypothetical protein